jgi:selenide,water dikinase
MLRGHEAVDALQCLIAADAQTSGGLLLCTHPDDADALTGALRDQGLPAAVVGSLRERRGADGVIELA